MLKLCLKSYSGVFANTPAFDANFSCTVNDMFSHVSYIAFLDKFQVGSDAISTCSDDVDTAEPVPIDAKCFSFFLAFMSFPYCFCRFFMGVLCLSLCFLVFPGISLFPLVFYVFSIVLGVSLFFLNLSKHFFAFLSFPCVLVICFLVVQCFLRLFPVF